MNIALLKLNMRRISELIIRDVGAINKLYGRPTGGILPEFKGKKQEPNGNRITDVPEVVLIL